MSGVKTFEISSSNLKDTLRIGEVVGRNLTGGETIDLVGDLGSGKTAFVRGLARAIGSHNKVQSPSFTINRLYHGKSAVGRKLTIYHFDFHRLEDPGLLIQTLTEALADAKAITVIEWSDVVKGLLPNKRLEIKFKTIGDDARHLTFKATGPAHRRLVEGLPA